MKPTSVFSVFFILLISQVYGQKKVTPTSDDTKYKKEITLLVQHAFTWADMYMVDLLPAQSNTADSICTGFNFKKHQQNLKLMEESGFFAKEFITNYDNIIKTLDRKIKAKEFMRWNVGDLPTFQFANDVTPWCFCQEHPETWDGLQVKSTSENKMAFYYNLGEGYSWTDNVLRVVKENGKWKIAYLPGFDYDEAIKSE